MNAPMIPIEYELNRVKDILYEMSDLVMNQIIDSRDSLIKYDEDLAEEIIRKELRVNALEITLDRDCEDILARYSPVATDLRLIISILKISESLERIGDHAYNIAKYVLLNEKKFNSNLINKLNFAKIFTEIGSMLNIVFDAFEEGDLEMAKKVFKQDKYLNKINKQAPEIIEAEIEKSKKVIFESLMLFRIIGKLERVGDHIKNIAEEVIFYHEDKIVKHKKRNKKLIKKYHKEIGKEEEKKEDTNKK
jgi:phosphate transport system protein